MFSKIVHFIACKNTEDAALVAHLFSEEVVSLHGILKTITSDMDVKFISKFSSAFHLQTNGQMEVVNRTLVNMLCCVYGDKQ